jgi:transposase
MDGGDAKEESRQTAGRGKRIRRHWTAEEKRRIMQDAGRPDAVRRQVAEHHGVHVSVLNRWRRELGADARRAISKKAARPVRLLPVQVSRSSPRSPPRPANRSLPATTTSVAGDLIEVAFPAGQRVTVRGGVNGEVLRAVLQELSRC